MKNNSRDSSKFKGCSPLQLLNGLIVLKPAIAYFAYTYRYCDTMSYYIIVLQEVTTF
jgi:hypothetical protein